MKARNDCTSEAISRQLLKSEKFVYNKQCSDGMTTSIATKTARMLSSVNGTTCSCISCKTYDGACAGPVNSYICRVMLLDKVTCTSSMCTI